MSQFGAASAGKNPPWARSTSDFSAAQLGGGTLNQQGQVGMPVPQPAVGQAAAVYNLGATSQGLQTQTLQTQTLQTQALQSQFQAQQLAVSMQQSASSQTQALQSQALQSQFQAQQMAAVRMQQAAVAAALQPQAQQTAVLPQPGIAIPTTLGSSAPGTVSYPAPRGQPAQTGKQRVFTGHVTKLHDNFGFVDEDVFFQTSCVRGTMPKAGDRVLVEATYNQNMPFKWNATRIQVLNVPTQAPPVVVSTSIAPGLVKPAVTTAINSFLQAGGGQAMPSVSSVAPPVVQKNSVPAPVQGPLRTNRRDRFERNRKREERDRRDKERDRPSLSAPAKRSRSPKKSVSPPSRTRSPARRRPRIIPRYVVQVPKISLDMKEANVMSLRSRYSNMYVPSDFFNSMFLWNEAFQLLRPFQLGNNCSFHVMHKDVERVGQQSSAVLDPPDADHLFSAKVMLIASPGMDELYHKSCGLSQDPDSMRENFTHPTRLLNFLVGVKGKNEPIAIGGPWSPSLDGPNPEEDPKVLIKTAIRTAKALTGINLSSCTQWYRFAEVRYLRPEEMHKGKLVPARVETSVIFLPDVWSCQPTRLEWDTLQVSYKKQLQKKLAQLSGELKEETQEDEEETDASLSEKKEPTHFSELDPKTMKIIDLRHELECRTLSSKGLKSQLIARLTKVIKTEQEKAEEEGAKETEEEKVEEETAMETEEKDEEKKKEEEERKKKEEKEKASLERRYTLPEQPSILVYPNPTAKGGKFDCAVMSLSVLLDYRPEDNKEHSFEVSLFAELFNEMLMRDFGFEIYKALCRAPEKPKEEEKKDKKEKERDKDKKKDEDKEPVVKKKKSDDRDRKDSDRKDGERGDKKDSKDKKKDEDSSKDGKKEDRQKEEEDDKEKKKDKGKYMTVNPSLLLACVYFDQNHTGYILDKDVEEIIHTLGLHMSRAQVKKLVQKVVSRDTLNYRKMTDKPLLEPEEEEKPEPVEMEVDLDAIAIGNKSLLGKDHQMATPSLKPKKEKSEEPLTGFIMYNGGMVDIESVMQRLERSEKSRSDMEKKLKETTEEFDTLKKTCNKKEETCTKLVGELKTVKQQLTTVEKSAQTSQTVCRKYQCALQDAQSQVTKLAQTVSTALGESVPDALEFKKEVKTETDENGSS